MAEWLEVWFKVEMSKELMNEHRVVTLNNDRQEHCLANITVVKMSRLKSTSQWRLEWLHVRVVGGNRKEIRLISA